MRRAYAWAIDLRAGTGSVEVAPVPRGSMLTGMASEYWYVKLPAGAKARGEQPMDTINRELTELVERGWEPISADSTAPTMYTCVMLRKTTP